MLARGLQEGLALAAAISTSRGRAGERPGDAAPRGFCWQASASGSGDAADVQLGRWRSISHPDGPEPTAVSRLQPGKSRHPRVGERWAGARQGLCRGLGFGARQRWGEAAGPAWLGERGFAFSSPGREARQGRQPAPPAALLRRGQGEARSWPAGEMFLSGVGLVSVGGSGWSKAAQLHEAGSISLSMKRYRGGFMVWCCCPTPKDGPSKASADVSERVSSSGLWLLQPRVKIRRKSRFDGTPWCSGRWSFRTIVNVRLWLLRRCRSFGKSRRGASPCPLVRDWCGRSAERESRPGAMSCGRLCCSWTKASCQGGRKKGGSHRPCLPSCAASREVAGRAADPAWHGRCCPGRDESGRQGSRCRPPCHVLRRSPPVR